MKLRVLLVFLFFSGAACAQSNPAPIMLEGDITGAQHQTYLEVPFEVPAGVRRISVDFSYTGREQRTTLDLGIADPERFRGASGGNKSHFTISETDATPSYLPGPIPAGRWKLLIAVPNIRAGLVSHYRADVRFNAPEEERGFASAALVTGMRWYRGDLHMHTAHSDGSCASQSGKRVPCPIFLTVQAAADRGLDFIAISDHNTDSHYDAMRELQPFFDKVLLIPGREITMFWGHFNIFGVTQFVDYRAVAHGGLDINGILRDVAAKGGIASINHADAPSGEACMGCGWKPPMAVDMNLVTGIEAINGGSLLSSTDFWDAQIAAGHRITGVGGSDNHNALIPAGQPAAIGRPTTVVEAPDLSVPAILDGVRHGRVFVDVTSSFDKVLDLSAAAGANHARMGENLEASAGVPVRVDVHVVACGGDSLHLLLDGRESSAMPTAPIPGNDEMLRAQFAGETGRHWVRAEVRDSRGSLVLLSNPVYINFPRE